MEKHAVIRAGTTPPQERPGPAPAAKAAAAADAAARLADGRDRRAADAVAAGLRTPGPDR